MDEGLPSVEVTADQLKDKLHQTRLGDSLEQVNRIMGREPFKTEYLDDKKVCFWGFKLVEEKSPRDQYEIYMGKFENDRLVFGSLLPSG